MATLILLLGFYVAWDFWSEGLHFIGIGIAAMACLIVANFTKEFLPYAGESKAWHRE